MSVAEFAAPGGLLGKTQKARNLFMATGAASGAVAQGAEDLGASEKVAPLIGAGTNLALDVLALKKGNLAVLSKEFLPSKSVLEKAKQLEKEAKKIDKDFKLSGAEVTGSSSVKAAESQVTATIAGNKVMDKLDVYLKFNSIIDQRVDNLNDTLATVAERRSALEGRVEKLTERYAP